ncbi:MAG: hypothetical protein EBU84_03600 [Actinobacteria bacterium]|nr:hypothetical protein [Actinomycetota bacterium]
MNTMNNMNNMTSDYYHYHYHNNVKFTGSAFESPSDAATILLQFVSLLAIIFGIVEHQPRN